MLMSNDDDDNEDVDDEVERLRGYLQQMPCVCACLSHSDTGPRHTLLLVGVEEHLYEYPVRANTMASNL